MRLRDFLMIKLEDRIRISCIDMLRTNGLSTISSCFQLQFIFNSLKIVSYLGLQFLSFFKYFLLYASACDRSSTISRLEEDIYFHTVGAGFGGPNIAFLVMASIFSLKYIIFRGCLQSN